MAANKFATMLHKNTNKLTLVLVYVLLEWILIIFLLLNSLFSYLTIKFADYFGLKRPCFLCSRLDHIFEPSKYNDSYRDLVCDDHANEILKLGFCSNHRKLAESRDCDENWKCSCCDVTLEEKLNLYFKIKPFWEDLDNASDGIRSDFAADDHEHEHEHRIEESKGLGIVSEELEQDLVVEEDDVQANEATKEREINVDANQGCKEAEEDKVSLESLRFLHKKLLLLDGKETGPEDSMDGSVVSDIEGADLTVEKLKYTLKTERRALNALYRELEEERSASEVAASQTMAMISRLQEEKSAMQMEALQYQRMMEEQSEYDQEALQILNELMVKREKEKAEIEKELDVYRRKVHDYEAKERTMMLRRRKDDVTRSASCASCSNTDDSDGVSVESKEECRIENHQIREDVNPNTSPDAVFYLEESLASFEDERLSILEQLKVLEDKLVSLNDEEEQVEHLYEENGNGFHETPDFRYETNGVANGHYQDKIIPMKRLLPLFDATDACIEDGLSNEHANGFDCVGLQHSSSTNSVLESTKHAYEEEVDHVYERLQALEADRQFLKHCIGSLKKGDKGIYLLQEILQHLRDLRSVEFRARSIEDAAI